jgi:hypothetical protein
MVEANRRVLPGFRLSLGFTLSYLSLLVLIPLAACFLKASALSLDEFIAAVWTPRARAAYSLTVGASLAAAAVNVPLGVLIAWVLVRYEFRFKRFFEEQWSTARTLMTLEISSRIEMRRRSRGFAPRWMGFATARSSSRCRTASWFKWSERNG